MGNKYLPCVHKKSIVKILPVDAVNFFLVLIVLHVHTCTCNTGFRSIKYTYGMGSVFLKKLKFTSNLEQGKDNGCQHD